MIYSFINKTHNIHQLIEYIMDNWNKYKINQEIPFKTILIIFRKIPERFTTPDIAHNYRKSKNWRGDQPKACHTMFPRTF